MFAKFVINTTKRLENRGWTNQNAVLGAMMLLLFLEGILITFVVTLGSAIFGMDTYINFKLTSTFTGFFGFLVISCGVINYFETKKI